MTQMLLQHCFSIFKNCLWGAEFLWINKSIPFMVLRRLILGITNARLQAVREVLGQFYLRLRFLSFKKVNGFHVYLSQLLVSVCGRGGYHCVLQGAIHIMIPEWLILYIFIYFSVFAYTIPKKTYRSYTSRVHPGFHSHWKMSFRYEIHYCIR